MAEERSRIRRRAPGIVLAALLAALLAGCTPADASLFPPSAPSPRPAPVIPPAPPEPLVVRERPEPVDPGGLPGIGTRLAAMRGNGFEVVARWATLPGAAPVNAALDERLGGIVRRFAEDRGTRWSPGVDVAEVLPCTGERLPPVAPGLLSIGCEIATAAGDVFAQRIVVRSETGEQRFVLYADAAGEVRGEGADLVLPGGMERVLALVTEALRADGRITGGARPYAGRSAEEQRAALADSILLPSDQLLVRLGHRVANRPVVLSVAIPVSLVRAQLSDYGHAVRDEVLADRPFAGAAPAGPGHDPVDCALVACVALTFDDGPTSLTPGLLESLRELRVPATFYLQGGYVEDRPDVVAATAAEGHELGNHTWGHPFLTELEDDQVRAEVERTQAAIVAASGVRPGSLRPPYGDYDRRVADLAGLPLVLWDIDTKDWAGLGARALIDRAVGWPKRGSIVLLHDTHSTTVAAVPRIVSGLRARGFAFATVSELLGGSLPGPGAVVSRGLH